jgi:hypothetical protein
MREHRAGGISETARPFYYTNCSARKTGIYPIDVMALYCRGINMNNELAPLCGAGLALVPIPPINGKPTKAPTNKGWNLPRTAQNPGGYSSDLNEILACGKGFNFGLYHGASNTLALDLDDVALARLVFEELTDFQLMEYLESKQRAEVKSPKANRGKLLFKLPKGFANTGLRQFKHDGKVIFELRSGNCQDVIHGQHPEGGEYQFIGNPAAIPEAPPVLLDMLQHWDDWKLCLDSVLGSEPEPPPAASPRRQQVGTIPGWRDPIREFNQSYGVSDVLQRNGYRQKGKDRFIRPGSESGAPGAFILHNCEDWVERVFNHHAGDVLCDGHPHDAFDCFRLLECGGDWDKALAWNPELTKHNQRLYRQEGLQNTPESPLQVDSNQGHTSTREKPLFPLISAPRLTEKPVPIVWLVQNIIERGSLNLLFGEPGAGKSLFALDWAFCMASGINWHGHKTQQTDVVIIAGEGFAGMARRLKALEAKYGRPAPAGLYISERPAQLLDPNNAQWVADSIAAMCPNPGLVIIDTLHRNMDGDENSSQDIGKFINNLDNFLKPLGAAVLVIHHSGHGQKDRSRGSSSIRAAMDGEFSATKEGGAIVLTCHKAKDFEAFKPLQFTLTPTKLDWCDEDRKPLTSVYLEKGEEIDRKTNKRKKLSANEMALLTSLGWAMDEHGVSPSAEIRELFGGLDGPLNENKKIVHSDHWKELAYKALGDSSPEAKRKAFDRGWKSLVNAGIIVNYDDYFWRIWDE